MKRFFLISTAHLEDALWFRDDEDFVAGMNYVAIVAFVHKNVAVYAFILMSNHVHFVVYGETEDVKEFIRDFKIRYSKYYGNRYGANNFLRRNDIDIREVAFETEDVKRAIAYVLMNCVAANICAHPSQYPWGSGNVAFQVGKSSGKSLGLYSARGLRRILHSAESSLPKNWLICEQGFILPQNYIPVMNLEKIFRTPQGMNYFFNNSSKAKKNLSSCLTRGPDREHRAAAKTTVANSGVGGNTRPRVLPTSQNPSPWNPSWLRDALTTRKDPESDQRCD